MLMEKVDLPQLWNIFNQVCRLLCAAVTLWRLIIWDRSGMDVWDAFFFFFFPLSWRSPPTTSVITASVCACCWNILKTTPCVSSADTTPWCQGASNTLWVRKYKHRPCYLLCITVVCLSIAVNTRYFDKNIKSVVETALCTYAASVKKIVCSIDFFILVSLYFECLRNSLISL